MTYTNQIPASPQVGDYITLNLNATYNIVKPFLAKVTVTAGKGGAGGHGQNNSSTGQGTPGQGGSGGRVVFEWKFAAIELKAVIGTNGGTGTSAVAQNWQSAAGGTGGAGGPTSLALDGVTIAAVSGGQGGTGSGANWYEENYCHYPFSGTNGANGTVTTMPPGGVASTGTPSGIIIEVLSANEPPTAPGSIEYGTPRAGKPIAITLTPATDPD